MCIFIFHFNTCIKKRSFPCPECNMLIHVINLISVHASRKEIVPLPWMCPNLLSATFAQGTPPTTPGSQTTFLSDVWHGLHGENQDEVTQVGYEPWTLWSWDKMAAILLTTLSNAFSWMKILEIWLKFHWSLFLRVQLTIFEYYQPYMHHLASMS